VLNASRVQQMSVVAVQQIIVHIRRPSDCTVADCTAGRHTNTEWKCDSDHPSIHDAHVQITLDQVNAQSCTTVATGVRTKSTLWGQGEGRSSKSDGLTRGGVLGDASKPPRHQLQGLCKLPRWGQGQSPGRREFWCILGSSGQLSCSPAIRPGSHE